MFGHYLPNKNEGATVAPKSKFWELNKGYNIIHTKSKLNAALKTDRSIVTTIFTAHMCFVDNTQ